jgi:hypothetical protein
MKKVFFISLFALITVFANAQSGTGNLDASNSTIIGGDGTGKIISATWVAQGTPPAPVVIANASAISTTVTVTKPGTYTFLVTLKDNLGNVATATVTKEAFYQQSIKVDVSASNAQIIIK